MSGRDPETRAGLIVTACGDDACVLEEVFRLLAGISGSNLAIEQSTPTTTFSPGRTLRSANASVGPTPGTRLGPYLIGEPIGKGGMGVVYSAWDSRLRRQVAIKLLPAETAADPIARERLRREAIAAAALDHPYICKVFEISEFEGTLFMAMEFIAGKTLYHLVREERIPLSAILHIAAEIAEALEEAHACRILHRDLKPANIMLTAQGHVKVMDFGLALRIENRKSDDNKTPAISPQITETGAVVGTPDYMSPEQVKKEALDGRSDLFSFGAILAEMISGRQPFHRDSPAETLSAILRDPPDFGAGVPEGSGFRPLVVIVRRMLAKHPNDRYASVAEMRADLAHVASAADTAETDGQPPPVSARIRPIGREAELAQLIRQLEEALAGRGSMVLIGGEPGIGKTHLTSAFLDAARQRGAVALIGRSYEGEGSPAYVPFIEMLEYSARHVPRETFRRNLGDDAPEAARLMPELRRIFPDIPPALELPPEQRRRFLFNSYRAFVERSAALTPIVALFEDLHWADEPTLLLLQHLVQGLAGMPVLVVGTYRDVDLDVNSPFTRTLETMLRQKLAVRILLRRLPLTEVGRMLAVLSSQEPPPSLARVVFDRTEGNPFFVEEVFQHLREEGMLFDEQGAFLRELKVNELQVPEGVRLVLGRRLSRLSEDARRILTTASVIGRSFPLDVLEDLEKTRPDAALEAIEEAERIRLVESELAGRHARYRFVHELVRQTLSDTLSLPRRQRLHARVAEAMERVYQNSLDVHIPALAHHLYQAGASVEPERAIHFLSEAARHASAAAAHEQALGYIENALSLLETERSERTVDLLVRRGIALCSLSRNREAVQEYERALGIADSLGDHARFVATCARIFPVHVWAFQIREMAGLLDRAAEHARFASAAERCLVLGMQASNAAAADEGDKALELLDRLEETRGNELQLMAVASQEEAYVRFCAGQLDLCEAAAQRASRHFETVGDLWGQASVDLGLFIPPLGHGYLAIAEQCIREAIHRSSRVGHDNARAVALCYLSSVLVAAGDLSGAERQAREALTFAEFTRSSQVYSAEAHLGRILFLQDRTEEALPLLEKAAGAPHGLFGGGFLAFSMAAAGDHGADEACRAAMRFLPRPGNRRGTRAWSTVIGLVQAFCLTGHREEAARLLPDAEKIAAEWEWSSVQSTPTRTVAGTAAASAGSWQLAEDHHRAAIARMDAVPIIIGQPVARYWYADMLAERGGPGDIELARQMLEQTIAASEAIGLALFARLARQRLSRMNPASRGSGRS